MIFQLQVIAIPLCLAWLNGSIFSSNKNFVLPIRVCVNLKNLLYFFTVSVTVPYLKMTYELAFQKYWIHFLFQITQVRVNPDFQLTGVMKDILEKK